MSKRELHITKGLALLFTIVTGMGILGTVGALEQKGGDVSWWQLIAFAAMFVACCLAFLFCDLQDELNDLKERTKNTYIKAHGKEQVIVPAEFEKVNRDKPCLNYRPTWEQGVPDEDGKVQRFRFTEIREEEGDENV